MIEQDTAATKDVVTLAVIYGYPVSVQFRHTVRTAWVEWRAFCLRHLLDLPEHLGRAGLIEANVRIHNPNRLKQVQRPNAGDLRGGNRLIKRNPDKALGCKVVDFSGLRCLQQANTGTWICEIVLDQAEVPMLPDPKLVEPPEIDRTGSTICSVNDIALLKQQLREICPILTCNASYNRNFTHVQFYKDPTRRTAGKRHRKGRITRKLHHNWRVARESSRVQRQVQANFGETNTRGHISHGLVKTSVRIVSCTRVEWHVIKKKSSPKNTKKVCAPADKPHHFLVSTILLDVTCLFDGLLPTGVDRVGLAYIEKYGAKARTVFLSGVFFTVLTE